MSKKDDEELLKRIEQGSQEVIQGLRDEIQQAETQLHETKRTSYIASEFGLEDELVEATLNTLAQSAALRRQEEEIGALSKQAFAATRLTASDALVPHLLRLMIHEPLKAREDIVTMQEKGLLTSMRGADNVFSVSNPAIQLGIADALATTLREGRKRIHITSERGEGQDVVRITPRNQLQGNFGLSVLLVDTETSTGIEKAAAIIHMTPIEPSRQSSGARRHQAN